jgi:hypothetical protein
MAVRTPREGRSDDEAAQDQSTESDGTDYRETEAVSGGGEQSAPPEAGAPESFQDFGRALQEQIAQALQPAVAEFREQMEQTVREQMEQAPQQASSGRQRDVQPAPESSRDDWQQSPRPSVQQPAQRDEEQRGTMADEDSGRTEDEDSAQPTDEDVAERPRQDRRGEARQLARRPTSRPARRRRGPGEVFDPRGAARVALLRLARNWREAGSTYQAIHAYTQILIRYPGAGAASAATEELIELAEILERQGRFYSALNIFDKLEELL